MTDAAFSKLKAHLRKAAKGTTHGLRDAIGRIVDLYSSRNARTISQPLVTMHTDRKPF